MSHDIIIATDFPMSAMFAFPFRTFVLDYYTIYFIEWMDLSHDLGFESERKRNAWIAPQAPPHRHAAHPGGLHARRQRSPEGLLHRRHDRARSHRPARLRLRPRHAQPDRARAARHPPRAPARNQPKPAVRGVFPGVTETDKLLIWNGGIVQWYDPVTLLHALAKIREHRDDVKLVFVGGAYPGLGNVGLGPRYQEAIDTAKDLGLYNTHAFFEIGWVPYERMKHYMLEADLAVCTYFNNLETHFCFRTRFVDVFWAELPLICTEGDVLADMVRDKELGIAVPERDPGALAAAIERLLDDGEFYARAKANIRENNKSMSWTQSFEHLVRFCKDPRSSALSKWRRTIMLGGAWGQWLAHRAATMWLR